MTGARRRLSTGTVRPVAAATILGAAIVRRMPFATIVGGTA